MSIKLLVDMNLSPDWVPVLQHHGWAAVHWSRIGDPRATDRMLMTWAVANAYVVFTHDLDFGRLLALTHATGPSVVQVRGQDVLPEHMESLVLAALRQHEADLLAGSGSCQSKQMPRTNLTDLSGNPLLESFLTLVAVSRASRGRTR